MGASTTTLAVSARAVSALALALALVSVVVLPVRAGDRFADVPSTHVFHEDVRALADDGVTRGCNPPDNTRFCPDDIVTRGQMAAFLDRALGLPDGSATFEDARGHLFADSIAALARAGITRGCNPPHNTRFCPDAFVTRGQMAAFLGRAGSVDVGPVVGAHVHALWSDYDDATRAAVLDQLRAAGIRSIRVDIGWSSVEERCSGCVSEWYVDRIDTTVRQARARGMDVLGVLWRTPSWAGDDILGPPDDPAEYGRVAGWIAERFEGRIAAWELWNEPNLDDYFHGDLDDYAALVRAAAPAIRAADPGASVVLGGPADNDAEWLEAALGRGLGRHVDVVAVHSYPTPADDPPTLPDPDGDPGRFAHLATVVDVVARAAPGTPVWVTEFGWSTHDSAKGAPPWKRGVTREQQARYSVEAIELLQERWPSVERAYLYRARDRASGSLHLDNFGLLDVDGRPKPVVPALRELLRGP